MAKGNRQYVMSGKVGNSVLYKMTDSNNKELQGERTYVAVVANPKTLGQSMQRVKMAPAVAFYRAFKNEILDHSFEGIKYGGRSHARFMKLAMNLASGYPFVEKGVSVLAPGNYVMSEGSLNGIPFDISTESLINVPSMAVEKSDTLADFSQFLISQCPWVHNGDQITFAFMIGGETVAPYAFVHRIVLDTESTTAMTSVLGAVTIDQDGNTGVRFGSDNEPLAGAAIIISRPSVSNTNGSISWQRSNSTFKVNSRNTNIMNRFFNQSAYEAAVRSYMTGSREVSSAWYLNQGKLKAAQQEIPVAPGVSIKVLAVQCKNEVSKNFGKWLAAIVNPTDGKTYVIAGNGQHGDADNGTQNVYVGYFGASMDDQPLVFDTVKANWEQLTEVNLEGSAKNISEELNKGLTTSDANYLLTISWSDAQKMLSEADIDVTFDTTSYNDEPMILPNP